MAEERAIGPGSTVVMYYTLALESGAVVDGTEAGEPLAFTLGDGTLIEGLERALYGLRAGDRQTLRVDPREGFGYPEEGRVHEMARTEFRADMPLEPGLVIGFTTPAGDELPGTVLAVGDDTVRVDFNHPLAGHTVVFDVEIVEVK
jgi:FKBP-type peptidyl-prolyl cis-trans isomerase SlpA